MPQPLHHYEKLISAEVTRGDMYNNHHDGEGECKLSKVDLKEVKLCWGMIPYIMHAVHYLLGEAEEKRTYEDAGTDVLPWGETQKSEEN